MSEIRNIRIPPRIDSLPLPERELREQPAQDWRYQIQGQRFDYRNGQILLNNQNLAQLIGENLTHLSAQYWTTLSRRLARYRDWATISVDDPEALAKFSALLHALLTKIFGRIKKKFDQTIDGVSFHLEDGQLLLNGVNVNAFLEMARKRRTEKGRVFLKGLRNRLALLQSNRNGNPNYEKIRETVERLANAIEAELRHWVPEIIALPAPLLPPKKE
ncbi:MAG TPA: hypothetical protein VFW62_04910 [bacterium]|nr:hypothetical protein [bacterium]